jgi:hypothetical protein
MISARHGNRDGAVLKVFTLSCSPKLLQGVHTTSTSEANSGRLRRGRPGQAGWIHTLHDVQNLRPYKADGRTMRFLDVISVLHGIRWRFPTTAAHVERWHRIDSSVRKWLCCMIKLQDQASRALLTNLGHKRNISDLISHNV